MVNWTYSNSGELIFSVVSICVPECLNYVSAIVGILQSLVGRSVVGHSTPPEGGGWGCQAVTLLESKFRANIISASHSGVLGLTSARADDNRQIDMATA